MPFGEITLGSKTTVTRDRPSSVFSADICLSSVFCLSSVAFLCVSAPFLFFCVFIVSSVIMGQSSSTPLSVMTDHEDRESQKMKPMLQESSLYPSLIYLDTEISRPPYMQPPLPLQLPQVLSVEQRRDLEPSALPWEGGRAQGTLGRTRRGRDLSEDGSWEVPSSTVRAFPVQVGPANPGGEQTYQYWPFSTSDLYNWKTQTPSFSKKTQGLIELLDSILFTHNPTWDDCQQLLQVLFTKEERERILSEA